MRLKQNEFVDVWDSCGLLGYMIPWAEWKTHGLFPTGFPKNPVEFVNLTLRERDHLNPPAVYIEDHIPHDSEVPDWSEVCNAIILAAIDAGIVQQAKNMNDDGTPKTK